MKDLYVLGTSPLDCIRVEADEAFHSIHKVIYRCNKPTIFDSIELAESALERIQVHSNLIQFECENRYEQVVAQNSNYKFDVSKLNILALIPMFVTDAYAEHTVKHVDESIDIPVRAKLSDYTWTELQALSKAHVDYGKYNIRVGDEKDNKTLVDISDKDHYDGLVFMYNTGKTACMNSCTKENEFGHNRGGYANSEVVTTMEKLYDGLEDQELKSVIKEVTVKCNDGRDNYKAIHELKCHMFIPSVREVGFNITCDCYKDYESYLDAEGTVFEYFSYGDARARRADMVAGSWVWLRSAIGILSNDFWCFNYGGDLDYGYSANRNAVLAAFVL